MIQSRLIARNSVALLFGNVANKVIGFLIMLSVARFLGAEKFGLYTFVFAYVAMFALVTDLGLTTIVVRGITQGDATGRRWLGNALLLRWPLALAAYLASVAGAFIVQGYNDRTQLIALSSLSFLTVPLSTYSAVFSARVKLYGPAFLSLGSRLILLVVVQWLARSGGSVAALIGAEVVIGSLSNLALWLWARSMLRPTYLFEPALLRQLLAEGIPLFLSSIFIALYFRIDVFFLGYFRDQQTIGLYAAAYRLTESLPLMASAATSSLFPILCQHVHAGNTESLARLVRVSLKILLALIIPVVFLLSFYSAPLIQALYGGRFEGSAPLLALLSFGQIPVSANILLSTLLIARGQSRLLMLMTAGMVALNVVLNFFVIPRYGAWGAAATTLATEAAGTLAGMVLSGYGRIFLQVFSRVLLPAAACAPILLSFSPRVAFWASPFWAAVVVLVLYPASLFVFRVFDPEEWKRLRNLVSLAR